MATIRRIHFRTLLTGSDGYEAGASSCVAIYLAPLFCHIGQIEMGGAALLKLRRGRLQRLHIRSVYKRRGSAANFGKRRTLMKCDMIRPAAFDLVLRNV